MVKLKLGAIMSSIIKSFAIFVYILRHLFKYQRLILGLFTPCVRLGQGLQPYLFTCFGMGSLTPPLYLFISRDLWRHETWRSIPYSKTLYWCTHVCMSVYVCVCIYIFLYECMFLFMCLSKYVQICLRMYLCMYFIVYKFMYTYVYNCVCVCVRMYVGMYECVFTYVCIYLYIFFYVR